MDIHSILNNGIQSTGGDLGKNMAQDKANSAVNLSRTISKILKKLEQRSRESRNGWVEHMDWTEMVSVLSGLLPNNSLTQGSEDNPLVDSFGAVRQAFPATYNAKLDSVGKTLEAMHSVSGKRYCEDHLTLLENLEDCKLISQEEAKRISLELRKEDGE